MTLQADISFWTFGRKTLSISEYFLAKGTSLHLARNGGGFSEGAEKDETRNKAGDFGSPGSRG